MICSLFILQFSIWKTATICVINHAVFHIKRVKGAKCQIMDFLKKEEKEKINEEIKRNILIDRVAVEEV